MSVERKIFRILTNSIAKKSGTVEDLSVGKKFSSAAFPIVGWGHAEALLELQVEGLAVGEADHIVDFADGDAGLREQLLCGGKAADRDRLPEGGAGLFFKNPLKIGRVQPHMRSNLFIAFDQVKCLLDVILGFFHIVGNGGLFGEGKTCNLAEQMVTETVHVEGIILSLKFVEQAEHVSLDGSGIGKNDSLFQGLQQVAEGKGMIQYIPDARKHNACVGATQREREPEDGAGMLMVETNLMRQRGVK